MQIAETYEGFSLKAITLPVYDTKVQAGFPSPADDEVPNKLDLNSYLIKRPDSTFFMRVAGDSMINAGIRENDLLIVDRSIQATHNKIVIAVSNNEFTIKRLKYINKEAYLCPENEAYQPIKAGEDCYIWGVVTSVIHQL